MKADAVVCGAGIAGVATAFQLAVEHGLADVKLVDPRPAFDSHVRQVDRVLSQLVAQRPDGRADEPLDRLLEDYDLRSGNAFHLTRQGYLYVTADRDRLSAMEAEADLITDLGGGPHDFYADGDRLRAEFPFLA